MVAKVAIDLALDRLFDYEVPGALEKKLAVGQLLSVPFGHREARGFLIEVRSNKEEGRREEGRSGEGEGGFSLRPVTAVVDETPFFSSALLVAVLWLRRASRRRG